MVRQTSDMIMGGAILNINITCCGLLPIVAKPYTCEYNTCQLGREGNCEGKWHTRPELHTICDMIYSMEAKVGISKVEIQVKIGCGSEWQK